MGRSLQHRRIDHGHPRRQTAWRAPRRQLKMETLEQRLALSTTLAVDFSPAISAREGGSITLNSATDFFISASFFRPRTALDAGDVVIEGKGTRLLWSSAGDRADVIPALRQIGVLADLDALPRQDAERDGSGDVVRIIAPPSIAQLPPDAELIDVAQIMQAPQWVVQRAPHARPAAFASDNDAGEAAPVAVLPVQEISAHRGRDMALEVAAIVPRQSQSAAAGEAGRVAETDDPSRLYAIAAASQLPNPDDASAEQSTASVPRQVDLRPNAIRDHVALAMVSDAPPMAPSAATSTATSPATSGSIDDAHAEVFAQWGDNRVAAQETPPVLPKDDDGESAAWPLWLAICSAPLAAYALRGSGHGRSDQVQPPPRRKTTSPR